MIGLVKVRRTSLIPGAVTILTVAYTPPGEMQTKGYNCPAALGLSGQATMTGRL